MREPEPFGGSRDGSQAQEHLLAAGEEEQVDEQRRERDGQGQQQRGPHEVAEHPGGKRRR